MRMKQMEQRFGWMRKLLSKRSFFDGDYFYERFFNLFFSLIFLLSEREREREREEKEKKK